MCIYICVCVCVCMCIYIYIYIYVYVCVYICVYICVCVCVYIYIYMCVCVYICVCVCVYICVCVCVYIYVCVCVYIYMCVCVYMYVCMYIYIYVCVCVYICVCVYVCMYVYVCICMYVYVYIYVCICMYVYVCIYVYVYIYIYIYIYICIVARKIYFYPKTGLYFRTCEDGAGWHLIPCRISPRSEVFIHIPTKASSLPPLEQWKKWTPRFRRNNINYSCRQFRFPVWYFKGINRTILSEHIIRRIEAEKETWHNKFVVDAANNNSKHVGTLKYINPFYYTDIHLQRIKYIINE